MKQASKFLVDLRASLVIVYVLQTSISR